MADAEPLWAALRQDVERQFADQPGMSVWRKARLALTNDSIWAMALYRLGRRLKTAPLRRCHCIAWLTYRGLEMGLRFASGIHLDVEASIGPGLYIGHFGSIYVGPGVRIGRNSSLGQMCYLGRGDAGFIPGEPRVGDRVYLGVGCKVMGGVSIGNDAAVGANAVVLSDVPEKAIVVGNPATVINYRGSDEFVSLKPSFRRADAGRSRRSRQSTR